MAKKIGNTKSGENKENSRDSMQSTTHCNLKSIHDCMSWYAYISSIDTGHDMHRLSL